MNQLEQDLFDAIITTRDFCGDEKEAARQVFSDHGLRFNTSIYRKVRYLVNARWNFDQRKAGVPEKYLW